MQLLSRIHKRITTDYHRYQFARAAAGILKTQPLAQGTIPFIALSMVHHRDVMAYLVAIRSFCLRANPQRIVVVCDPSIVQSDKDAIRHQIPHVEFRHADEFTHPDIPRGGCWERLFAISEYNRASYVVQVDADTVASGPLDEVVNAVQTGNGFTIGECPNQKLMTFDEAHTNSAPWQSSSVHIQGLAEYLLPRTGLIHQRYVRGCAGFTGFPATDDMRERLVEFSKIMKSLTQSRWAEWGTEQFASNYLVANMPDTVVLPFPEYTTPDACTKATRFVHFIGSMRFINDAYEKAARKIIAELI